MPQVLTSTYPTAEDSITLARALSNDMLVSTAGETLTDNAPFAISYLNAAQRKLQRYLANNGLNSNVKDNVILTPLTACPLTSDPSVQVSIGANGYFDGVSVHANPSLPLDLILPLKLWERQTGSNGNFVEMTQPEESLPSRIPKQFFGQWEFRGDAIYMTGSTISEDLRLRYEASLPAIATAQNQDLSKVIIPIRDGLDALACYIVEVFAFARGSAMRVEAKSRAKEEADELINRYVRRDQRIAFRARRFRSGQGRGIDDALSGSYR